MRPGRHEDVNARIPSGVVLKFLAVFALLVVLLVGNVRLYELKEENRQLSEALAEQQQVLTELRQTAAKGESLYERAIKMGLRPPKPEEIRILRVRQGS